MSLIQICCFTFASLGLSAEDKNTCGRQDLIIEHLWKGGECGFNLL